MPQTEKQIHIKIRNMKSKPTYLLGAVPRQAMEGSPSLRTAFKITFMLGLLRQEPDLISYTSLISAAAKI